MLADPDAQAIYVATPNSLHREWTIRAAEAGKHVLCEKPLSVDADEALEMAAACKSNGVTLMEAFSQTFRPQDRLIKRLIEEGRIGKLMRMNAIHSGGYPAEGNVRLDASLAGGALMDKGCYCINTARFLFGQEPASVYATAEFGPTGVDERLSATMQFPSGGIANFETSFRLAEGTVYSQGCELFGDRGRIWVPFGFSSVATYRFGTIVDTAIYVSTDNLENPKTEKIDCPGVHQWQLQVEYFAVRVLSGQPLEFPAEDGVANMRVIDAVYASARQGRVVEVE